MLWNVAGNHEKRVHPDAAFRGKLGTRLISDNDNHQNVTLSTVRPVVVAPGSELSVVGMVRASSNASATLQLVWYQNRTGSVVDRTISTVPTVSGGQWNPFRLDVTVPPNAVAVGLFLRLTPSREEGQALESRSVTASMDIDEVQLIKWAPPDTLPSPLYDHFQVVGPAKVRISKAQLPGAGEWTSLARPVSLPERERSSVSGVKDHARSATRIVPVIALHEFVNSLEGQWLPELRQLQCLSLHPQARIPCKHASSCTSKNAT